MLQNMAAPPVLDVSPDLIARYDRPGPRYTSYPTAVEFHEGFGPKEYLERLERVAGRPAQPLSLYVHLPFCHERCSFCGCNVIITTKLGAARDYLGRLIAELDLLADRLGPARELAQFHLGGGTPTYYPPQDLSRLMAAVRRRFGFGRDAELACEVDPRVTTEAQLATLRSEGFNRISMGVQDFSAEVQAAITRHQSEDCSREFLRQVRAAGFVSTNIDLVYGLPRQRLGGFRHSLDVLVELRPERIALYSFALVPWIKANQFGLPLDELPGPDVKLQIFLLARRELLAAGYRQIGMDHFALPKDELARSAEAGTLHRNFQGYTTKPATDTLGLGISAIGDLAGAYAQNTKKLADYYRAVDAGRFATARGYALSDEDRLRREWITKLMCNFRIDLRDFAARWHIDVCAYFASDLALLEQPLADGLVEIDEAELRVTPLGRFFIRNICMAFDPYLRGRGRTGPTFSRTV